MIPIGGLRGPRRLVPGAAVAGDPEEAERLLREHPIDPLGLWGVHGRAAAQAVVSALHARKRGNAAAARRILESAKPNVLFRDVRVLDYFIGETCHLAGDDACAVSALADGHRFIWAFLPGAVAYPRSRYLLARSYERLGRREEARATIGKLVATWKDADADLPLLYEAKALCRRVECRVP